jgi:hypothetical protein
LTISATGILSSRLRPLSASQASTKDRHSRVTLPKRKASRIFAPTTKNSHEWSEDTQARLGSSKTVPFRANARAKTWQRTSKGWPPPMPSPDRQRKSPGTETGAFRRSRARRSTQGEEKRALRQGQSSQRHPIGEEARPRHTRRSAQRRHAIARHGRAPGEVISAPSQPT